MSLRSRWQCSCYVYHHGRQKYYCRNKINTKHTIIFTLHSPLRCLSQIMVSSQNGYGNYLNIQIYIYIYIYIHIYIYIYYWTWAWAKIDTEIIYMYLRKVKYIQIYMHIETCKRKPLAGAKMTTDLKEIK